jgi:hypothetical protein
MHATRPHSPLRRRLAWLLWLALLLPLAQSAAAWHGYSHTVAGVNGDGESKQSTHRASCDLCLTAAAVIGGALVGNEPARLVRDARHELPQPAESAIWLALLTLAYLSRAPPPAPR